MDNILGTLVYRLTGDNDDLNASLNESRKKMQALGTTAEETSAKIRKLAKGAITAALVKSLLDASSRVEELNSKFETVFGNLSSNTDQWAREYASATSRGVTATKEFLATQQDLRTGYGDTTESATEYSKAVVAITNDLASFSNIPVEQAMQSMQSGLNQQFEALRTLGVSLSVATLEQGEYAQSLGKTWEQMSALEKQEAILSGIVSQSPNALHQSITSWKDYRYELGDAARTADSFANSSQGLLQTLDDFKAEIGDAILPFATELSTILTYMLKDFMDLPEPIKLTTTAVAGLSASIAVLGGPVGTAVGLITSFAIGIGSIDSAQEKLTEQTKNLTAATQEYGILNRKLSTSTKDLADNERKLLEAQKAIQKSKATEALSKILPQYDKLNKELAKGQQQIDAYQARFDALNIVMESGQEGAKKAAESIADSNSVYSRALKNQLQEYAGMGSWFFKKEAKNFNETYVDLYTKLIEVQGANADVVAEQKESVIQLAYAYKAGLIDIELFKDVYSDLYNEIVKTAEEIKELDEAEDTTKKLTYSTQDWTIALKEQQAEMAESVKQYEEAFQKKKEVNELEHDEAIRKLASDANLIKSGEDVATMDIATIRERITAKEGANTELLALDEYYTNEEKNLAKERDTALAENIYTSTEWAKAIKEQQASILESNKKYKEAYQLKKEVNDLEHEEAIRKIATDAGLIESTENVATIDIEILRARIAEHKEANEEMLLSDQYYATQAEELLKERNNSINELIYTSKSWRTSLKEQRAEIAKNANQYRNVTGLRKQLNAEAREDAIRQLATDANLIESGENVALMSIETLQERIRANKNANTELIALEEYYANEAKLIDKDLTDTRKENAKAVKDMLKEQQEQSQENAATELENVGSYKEATAIRIKLLQEERDIAIKEMEAKVRAGGATEADLLNIKKYYANEEELLLKEQSDKFREYLLESINTALSSVSSFVSAVVDLYSSITNARIAQIDEETNAQLTALGLQEETTMQKLQKEYNEAVKNGDMELAQEKARDIERQRIEDEAEERKKELQREQAEREKKLAIFEATISTISSVIGFLADPGGWPGVALSAMAAATGAAQIAAIAAEPLPSYAVGAVDVSEDHIAQVHQGELIIPKTFAEGVRDGDISIGGASSEVNVTIINNTGAEISTERTDEQNITDLKITIGKLVSAGIASGKFDNALTQRFTINRRNTRA